MFLQRDFSHREHAARGKQHKIAILYFNVTPLSFLFSSVSCLSTVRPISSVCVGCCVEFRQRDGAVDDRAERAPLADARALAAPPVQPGNLQLFVS